MKMFGRVVNAFIPSSFLRTLSRLAVLVAFFILSTWILLIVTSPSFLGEAAAPFSTPLRSALLFILGILCLLAGINVLLPGTSGDGKKSETPTGEDKQQPTATTINCNFYMGAQGPGNPGEQPPTPTTPTYEGSTRLTQAIAEAVGATDSTDPANPNLKSQLKELTTRVGELETTTISLAKSIGLEVETEPNKPPAALREQVANLITQLREWNRNVVVSQLEKPALDAIWDAVYPKIRERFPGIGGGEANGQPGWATSLLSTSGPSSKVMVQPEKVESDFKWLDEQTQKASGMVLRANKDILIRKLVPGFGTTKEGDGLLMIEDVRELPARSIHLVAELVEQAKGSQLKGDEIRTSETDDKWGKLKELYVLETTDKEGRTMMAALYWYIYDEAVQSIPGKWRKIRSQEGDSPGAQVSSHRVYVNRLNSVYAKLKVLEKLSSKDYLSNRLALPGGGSLADKDNEDAIRKYIADAVEKALQESMDELVNGVRNDYNWFTSEFPNEAQLRFIKSNFVNPLCDEQRPVLQLPIPKETTTEQLVAVRVVGGVLRKYLEPYVNQYKTAPR